MAGLAVHGDPDGWLDAGRSISTLMVQLESDLSDASALDGQALARSWYGPAATSFAAHWGARRSRYEDLLGQAQRAARAIAAYGERLADMALQAATLETIWCGAGLHILDLGAGFMLPPGVESMPAPAQISLRQALSESVTAVERLGADGVAAAEDLALILGSVIALLEDFSFIELGILRGVADEFIAENKDPLSLFTDGVGVVGYVAGRAADNAGSFASQLGYYLREGTAGERSAAGELLPDAGKDAANEASLAKWAGVAGVVVSVAAVGWQVRRDARTEGYGSSLEQNAGSITSTAISVAGTGMLGGAAEAAVGGGLIDVAGGAVLAAGAPEILVGVGVVAAGAVVAAGVGYTVQSIVDHRRAIGHFVESAF